MTTDWNAKVIDKIFDANATQSAAQEKQLPLSRLLAQVAHEIRNPLSSLDIHLQLLEEDLQQAPAKVKTKVAGRFEMIHGELRRLENIVKHFVGLAGPSSLNLEPVELKKIIVHVCELLGPEAITRGISITMDVPDILPRLIADPVKLMQVLINLVINAIQAIEGDGVIEVTVQVDDQNDVFLIQIRDTGPGVPTEKRSAIFEPFFTTKTEGSGLGLWVAQQIISAHGGTITVSEALGGGAVFSIQLPDGQKRKC